MQTEGILLTAQIKALWATVQQLQEALTSTLGDTSEKRERITEWVALMFNSLQRLRNLPERRYAGRILAGLLQKSLELWQFTLQNAENKKPQVSVPVSIPVVPVRQEKQQEQHLRTQIAVLEMENVRLHAQIESLQRQQTPTTVEIPSQTVTLRSAVDREILRLMATTGQARSWRLVNQVLSAGLTDNANTVRNAIRRLKDQNLIEDYTWNHKVQVWSPGAGGGRQLLRLTARGRMWAEMAFRTKVAPCELDELAQRHKGVSHAIAILETLEHLRIAGYSINNAPGPLLVNEDERWGQRSEPDLVAIRDNVTWTVEVQREVNARNNEKWAKSLELSPRLMLITLSAQLCNKQAAILRGVIRQGQFPPGEIRLASLEAMEKENWQWIEFHS